MVVITMTNCPPKLRGDLSKWLCEINTGVYVGQVSARVRDALWSRVCENICDGQATMVYSTLNEQHLEFCTHNNSWKVKDFDGIKLMQHPKVQGGNNFKEEDLKEELPKGFSTASKRRMSARMKKLPEEYVFLDIETTGLDVERDKIIEIGFLRASSTEVKEEWEVLIYTKEKLPENIVGLTGITDEMLQEGIELKGALEELDGMIGNSPIISYNAVFDMQFLRVAHEECGLEFCVGRVIDALALARKRVHGIANFKLETLAEHFGIEYNRQHRALDDCRILYQVYLKLNEI